MKLKTEIIRVLNVLYVIQSSDNTFGVWNIFRTLLSKWIQEQNVELLHMGHGDKNVDDQIDLDKNIYKFGELTED